MALNRYSTSSRFTDITSDDEEGKKKETNKEINERREREYAQKVAERQELLQKEDDLFNQRNRSIEAYDRSLKEGSITSGKLDTSRFSGGAVKTSPETLTKFNERELAAGRPVATSLLRPGSFATDEEFLAALEPKEYQPGSIFHAKYERPSEYIKKEFPKIKIPDLETERLELELIKPGMLKGEDRELVGLDRDRGEYVDPKKPFVSYEKGSKEKFPNKKARRKANLEALFKKDGLGASKPERVKGRFKNLGEKRKYKKEEKLAKATYGRGFEQLTGTELEERKANLKEMKREQMSPFKRDYETNKITGINKPRFFKNLSINQDARKEIRDINRAQKYSKLVGGSETNRNVYSVSDRVSRNMIDKEKNPGPKYFKPEVMKNFRSSDDNPLNRNSSSRFFE